MADREAAWDAVDEALPAATVGLARTQLEFAEPDWLGDVIERHGLTPPAV